MGRWANRTLLVLGVLVAATLYVRIGLTPVTTALAQVRPGDLLGYLMLAVAIRLGYALRWHGVARHLGAVPPVLAMVAARLAGDAVGMLAPVGRLGGDPVRVGLLYRTGVGGARASAGVVIDRILEVLGNSVAAILYVTVFATTWTSLARTDGSVGMVSALVVSAVALIGLLVAWAVGARPLSGLGHALGLTRHAQTAHWLDRVGRTEGALGGFCGDRPTALLWGFGTSLVIEALIVVEHLVLFRTFGIALDLPTLFAVLMSSGLARAVPVPAGLGALEASQVAVLTLTHGRPDVGLVVGVLLRLHDTVWIVVGLGALAVLGVSPTRVRLLSSPHRAPA